MDAKTFYEQIAPELDPGGFKLYFTAQRLTGFELYKQFPYEDSRGMFEMMNGHQLMRYLLADQFHAIRWEIVPGTCYERAVLLPIDRTTPAYTRQNSFFLCRPCPIADSRYFPRA